MLNGLEDFWVNYGDYIILITGAITLIGVVYNLIKGSRISEKAVSRAAEAEQLLSAEHKGLFAKQEIMLERSLDTKTAVQTLSSEVRDQHLVMVEERAERRAQYSNLNDVQKELASSASKIGKFADEYVRLASENIELKRECLELSQKAALLEERLASKNYSQYKEHASDWEPER